MVPIGISWRNSSDFSMDWRCNCVEVVQPLGVTFMKLGIRGSQDNLGLVGKMMTPVTDIERDFLLEVNWPHVYFQGDRKS